MFQITISHWLIVLTIIAKTCHGEFKNFQQFYTLPSQESDSCKQTRVVFVPTCNCKDVKQTQSIHYQLQNQQPLGIQNEGYQSAFGFADHTQNNLNQMIKIKSEQQQLLLAKQNYNPQLISKEKLETTNLPAAVDLNQINVVMSKIEPGSKETVDSSASFASNLQFDKFKSLQGNLGSIRQTSSNLDIALPANSDLGPQKFSTNRRISQQFSDGVDITKQSSSKLDFGSGNLGLPFQSSGDLNIGYQSNYQKQEQNNDLTKQSSSKLDFGSGNLGSSFQNSGGLNIGYQSNYQEQEQNNDYKYSVYHKDSGSSSQSFVQDLSHAKDENKDEHNDENTHKHKKEDIYYKFEYKVDDKKTGDIKHQVEERKGDVVNGEYALRETDGNIRTVKYYADWKTGFHAQVHNSKHH